MVFPFYKKYINENKDDIIKYIEDLKKMKNRMENFQHQYMD